ncbi:MAG: Glycosyl transferase family protein [Microgenomates group bacterium Gr01-1014_7]|nr:MAG: Glycosyl transferase family protein [Microgenomates group bacterium Gr01-1014_7]
MPQKISVIINTRNEEKNIAKAINSVKWADEIIVCDMYSDDKTAEIAKDLGAKVIFHKRVNYVELARNFAISKAKNDWILVLDPDEQIDEDLAKRLQALVNKSSSFDFVEIPRKNIIFNKWIKHSGWWPDYQIRLFKKGSVVWQSQIHSKPQAKGTGLKLASEEKWSIIHQNYQTIEQFISRMNRYTQIQAEELKKSGYKFRWQDIFDKPLNEFLSRYFTNEGYKDGLHGLSLSLLQAFSFFVVYLRVWETTKFKEQELNLAEFENQTTRVSKDINYWIKESKGAKGLKKFLKIFKR